MGWNSTKDILPAYGRQVLAAFDLGGSEYGYCLAELTRTGWIYDTKVLIREGAEPKWWLDLPDAPTQTSF